MSLVERIASNAETRMALENIAWETYVALADQRRGSVPRLTFDCGVLALMSPKREHENLACLLGRIGYREAIGFEQGLRSGRIVRNKKMVHPPIGLD